MSYDYMLGKGSIAGGMEGFAESVATQTIGPAEPLKTAISRLFPALTWRQFPSIDVGGHSSWFGYQGPPEFHLIVEADHQVRVINMSHCERAEVERVARELGLVAFDGQSLEVFG
jgi:hypothetical protein